MNLITYSLIRDIVKRVEVKIHGCYYNLSDCSLEFAQANGALLIQGGSLEKHC
jgi:uncharacterized protein YraI